MAEIYNLLERQIPMHIREKYPVFCTFVEYYYRWLQTRGFSDIQNITDIDLLDRAITITDNNIPIEDFVGHMIIGESGAKAFVVGISADGKLLVRYKTKDAQFSRQEPIFVKRDYNATDKSLNAIVDGVFTIPSVFIDEFANMLDSDHIFGLDTNNIAQILKHIKELYRAKGSEEALKYFLKINQGVDAEIRYPFDQVLKPSDGKWVQQYSVTIKTAEEFKGVEPIDATSIRFIKYDRKPYEDFAVSNVEIFNEHDYIRFYLESNPKTYLGQLVEIIENDEVIYAGNVVEGYESVHVLKGGKKWQVGQIFQIGGKDGWGTVDLCYDEIKRPWYKRNKTDPTKDYGEFGEETFLQREEKPTICRVTEVDQKDNGMVHAEIIQLGEYVRENKHELYYVSPLFYQTGEEWEEEYDAVVTFDWGVSHRQVGHWEDASGFLSYHDIVLQDSYYYQQFSYDIVSTANPDTYQNLATALHPVGTKLFTTYVLHQDVGLDDFLDVDVIFPYTSLSFFDVANVVDSVSKTVKKVLDSDKSVVTDSLVKTFIKNTVDDIITKDKRVLFDLTKQINDVSLTTDSTVFTFKDLMFDATYTSDYVGVIFEKPLPNDAVNTSDYTGFTLHKVLDTDIPEIQETIGKIITHLEFDGCTASDTSSRITLKKV